MAFNTASDRTATFGTTTHALVPRPATNDTAVLIAADTSKIVAHPGAMRAAPEVGCNPSGDSVQPRCQRVPAANRTGLACEGEERGLEHLLGIVLSIHEAPTHGPDARCVPPDECGECRLVSVPGKAIQEL